MVKLHGDVALEDGRFVVRAEPHVVMRLKRVFAGIDEDQHGAVTISATDEHAEDLLWFLSRWPMRVAGGTLGRIVAGQRSREDRRAAAGQILADGYVPKAFALAFPPRPYQAVAAELALRQGGLLIADDVGLGKTVEALAILADPATRPALVVTMAHLTRQWEAEALRFLPGVRVHRLRKGSPYALTTERRRTVPFPDVIVGNYHKLGGWAETLAPLVKTVIFDEVQELRNAEKQAGELTRKYAGARAITAHARWRVGLSATPIYNYGGEMFNVLDVLCPGALGTWAEFAREWCRGWHDKKKARLADPRAFGHFAREEGLMLRRTRGEVGRELPPLQRIPHAIDADLAKIDDVRGRAAELARIVLAREGFTPHQKLQASEQLSNALRQATGLAKAPYVAAFVRLLVESGEKVVLFGWHRAVYEIWREELKDLGVSFYTGSESEAQKAAAARDFVTGWHRVLIMSLRAGAGLDGLQHVAHVCVFGELDWSPGVHEQCIGRVCRDGQPESTLAYFLLSEAGSDPVMADVLGVKTAQVEGVRNPTDDVLEELQIDEDHIKRLAADFLERKAS